MSNQIQPDDAFMAALGSAYSDLNAEDAVARREARRFIEDMLDKGGYDFTDWAMKQVRSDSAPLALPEPEDEIEEVEDDYE